MKKSGFLIIFLMTISFLAILSSNITNFYYSNGDVGILKGKNELEISQPPYLIIGVRLGPIDIDPHFAWDPYSYNVIDRVCEGLFAYNYSDPSNSIIPRLASDFGFWSNDELNYTVSIRQNITFHDGSSFNATALQWNYIRLSYFLNISSIPVPEADKSAFTMNYIWPDGTPIINRTEVIDLYTIRYVLNKPFSAFEGLLCFSGSYILSQLSTDPVKKIDTYTGKLIGTGPYTYEHYEDGVEVRIEAYDGYWKAKPEIRDVSFAIIQDPLNLNKALLSGDIDVLINPLPSFLDTFNESSDITLIDQEGRSWVSYYVAMHNKHINQTFREAISYAVDYDYIMQELKNGSVDRLKSPVPKGIVYSNYSLNVPSLNIPHARQVMKSMGYGVTFTTDIEWESATFATLNFTYLNISSFYSSLASVLMNNLSKIGIKVEDTGTDNWYEYLMMLVDEPPFSRDMLQLYVFGWCPDYNDPSQLINVLFSNETNSLNVVEYNGGYGGFNPYNKEEDVQLLMERALNITDKSERKIIYDKIQKLIIERDYPVLWMLTPKLYVAYNNDLEGFQENTFCTVNEDNEASLKGDMIFLKWKSEHISVLEPIIPGYSPVVFSLIFVIFIYNIIRKRYKMVKIN